MNKTKVFNLHFIDACNFNCHHCFIKKENNLLSLKQIKTIVDKIEKYSIEEGILTRINLAGGEPLLCNYLQDIIDYINSKNIEVSLITNGYLLTKEFIEKNAKKLSMIGISVDSLNESTIKSINRCCGNNYLDEGKLTSLYKYIKHCNIKLKINICISKLNIDENMSQFIQNINPDRLKLLQIVPENKFGEKIAISLEEFKLYCDKYDKFNPIIENIETMKKSYFIIDSKGYFCTNNLHNDNSLNILSDLEIKDCLKTLKR